MTSMCDVYNRVAMDILILTRIPHLSCQILQRKTNEERAFNVMLSPNNVKRRLFYIYIPKNAKEEELLFSVLALTRIIYQ